MRFNKIEDVYKVFDEFIKNWDLNENGEKDSQSITNNCHKNTVAVYHHLKYRGYSNKCEIVTGSYTVNDSKKLLHSWNKIKIKQKWVICDITNYYNRHYNQQYSNPTPIYYEGEGGFEMMYNGDGERYWEYSSGEDAKRKVLECSRKFNKHHV